MVLENINNINGLAATVKTADSDGDFKLSETEAKALSVDFAKVDTNQDGLVEAYELMTAVNQARQSKVFDSRWMEIAKNYGKAFAKFSVDVLPKIESFKVGDEAMAKILEGVLLYAGWDSENAINKIPATFEELNRAGVPTEKWGDVATTLLEGAGINGLDITKHLEVFAKLGFSADQTIEMLLPIIDYFKETAGEIIETVRASAERTLKITSEDPRKKFVNGVVKVVSELKGETGYDIKFALGVWPDFIKSGSGAGSLIDFVRYLTKSLGASNLVGAMELFPKLFEAGMNDIGITRLFNELDKNVPLADAKTVLYAVHMAFGKWPSAYINKHFVKASHVPDLVRTIKIAMKNDRIKNEDFAKARERGERWLVFLGEIDFDLTKSKLPEEMGLELAEKIAAAEKTEAFTKTLDLIFKDLKETGNEAAIKLIKK